MNDRFGFAAVTWLRWASLPLRASGCKCAAALGAVLSGGWAEIWHFSSSWSLACTPFWLPSPGAAPAEEVLVWCCLTESCSKFEDWVPPEVADGPSAAWECHVRLAWAFCCWNRAVLSMIPMNGVLRGLCSAMEPWTWLMFSLSRTSGPLTLSEKLPAEVKLLVELARITLLDGEAAETALVPGPCCLPSLKFFWVGAVNLSAVLEDWEERLSSCCEQEHWLEINSLYSSALAPVGTLADDRVLVPSTCWILACRTGKGLWGRCWKDDCVFGWHGLLPILAPGWPELRCWFVLTICACLVGCTINPGSLRYFLPALLWGDAVPAFCWAPSWRVLLYDAAAAERGSRCGEETESSEWGSSSSLSWRLQVSFTPCAVLSSSLSELFICCSSCGDWCFCCCALWNCLHSSSTRARRRFISWLLGHSCVASRRSARAARSFLVRKTKK